MPKLKLIVGLGNPGKEYENTRHNAGALFVEAIAEALNTHLLADKKFQGLYAKVSCHGHDCHLLLPTTYMNLSGQAVQATARFYKIKPEEILVVHDDLDLPVGTIKLKVSGGHGGHNGLKSIIAHLGSNNFMRLRLGIGHPGQKEKVIGHVLSQLSSHDKQALKLAIDKGLKILPELFSGTIEKATQTLHTN